MGIYSALAFLTLGATIFIYAGLGVRGPLLWVPMTALPPPAPSEFKIASVLVALALFGVSIGVHFLL